MNELIAELNTQLGGQPLVSPREWFTKTNCAYKEPPKGPKLAAMTHGKDHATYHLARHILAEELEHEDTFANLL